MMKDSQIKRGRNEACFCGSGNKYKKCCLSVEEKSLKKLPFKQATGEQYRYSPFSRNLEIKMSEIILHLAEDILEFATTKSQHKQAITAACLAWNLAVMFDEQQEELDKLLDKELNDPQYQVDSSEIVRSLIQKKNYYYPDINRLIVDFELRGNKNNFHLHVLSTLP